MIENPQVLTDMELINILYMQDIDIGIGRDVFDSGYWQEDSTGDEQKKTKLQDTNGNQPNESEHESDQSASDAFPQLDLREHYMVDNETGELVPVPSPIPVISENECNQQQFQTNSGAMSVPNTPQIDMLQPMLVGGYSSGSAVGSLAMQYPSVTHLTYERQSSLDQRWSDIFSVIETNASAPDMHHHAVLPIVASSHLQSNTVAAVVHNASMNMALGTAVDDSYTLQTNFSLSPPEIFPNYSNELDSSSMFIPEPILPAEQNHTLFDASNTVFGLDQLSLGLFGNMGLAPTLNMESSEAELLGVVDTNFTMFPTTTGSSVSFIADESNISHDLTQDQPVSALNAVDELDMNNTQALLQQMIHSDLVDDLDLSDIMDDDYVNSTGVNHSANEEDWSSDSAVSSMASPAQQLSLRHVADEYEVTNEDGATGGIPKYEMYQTKSEDDGSDYFESSFPFSYEQTFSGSSNFTNSQPSAATSTKHVFHNHTYTLPQGRKSREELEAEAKREKEERATRSRDEKRAKAMKVPLTMEEIIDSSVEEFTELIGRHHLNDAQQQLVRDIRRRGKNKMAAQNCRKRKMEVIQTIDDEVLSLRERRDALRRQRNDLDRSAAALKEKFKRLESELFRRLRDESGREYDPNLFALLQTDDGGVFIVPRSNSTNERAATSDKSQDEKSGRKRKPKRKD